MKRQVLLFNIFTAAIFTLPAYAADDGITGVQWGRNAYNFEAMPSGPQPVKNLSRRPDGVANSSELVGDYRNPILTPEAAAAATAFSRVFLTTAACLLISWVALVLIEERPLRASI